MVWRWHGIVAFYGVHVPGRSMYAIFSYIYHEIKPNVGKDSSPMEHMG